MDVNGLRNANAAFYVAFERQDLEVMAGIWARSVPVTCAHPGWDLVAGYDSVLQSWRAIFEGSSEMRIRVEEPHVTAFEGHGWVVCKELLFTTVQGAPVENTLAATNTYVLEDGLWKIAHHQAGPVLAGRARTPRPPESALH